MSAVTMADKNKAVNNTDNKRHLSDTSRSFSDVVRTPKKKRETSSSSLRSPEINPEADQSMNSKLPINSSTPANPENYVHYSDNASFHPLLPNAQLVLGDEDIMRIARAVKVTLREEIEELVAREVAKAVEPLKTKISKLEEENGKLFLQIDELEQYGRRPLVRVSGIPETNGEDTTRMILDASNKAGVPLQPDDVIVSHRVGRPHNRSTPRQIIARLKSVDVKFRLVKNFKKFKENPDTRNITINEDLTKYRDRLMFLCRKLCRANQLKKVWSTNGKILIRDLRERTHAIRQESDLVRFGHVMQSLD